jgi:Helix-turn-helix domain
MARFVNAQVPEVVQPFWAALQAGDFIADAAVAAGTYRKQGTRWVAACGGVRPRRGRNLTGRCLSFAEREEIALAHARGEKQCAIAQRLGRSPSTVSRELKRNADRDGGYRATTAHARAFERASRPKPAKLATNRRLRRIVQDDLQRRFSPEQIAGRLRRRFPDEPEMWVSTETIYQSHYLQWRGALKRELTRYLRTGRALRKPGRQAGQRKNRIPTWSTSPSGAGGRRPPGARPLGGRPVDRQAQRHRDRHAGRARQRLCHARAAARRLQARARRARARPQGADAARGAAPLADLGPGAGDARLQADPRRRRHRGLLLRPARPLATPTRTPTGCYASTGPRAPTSPPSPTPNWTPSPTNSTSGRASASTSPTQPSTSPSCCCNDRQNPPIRLRHTAGAASAKESSQTTTSSTVARRRFRRSQRVGRRPRGCPHCDTSLGGVYEERAAADRGMLSAEEVTADEVADVAASARASRRAAVAGGSGGSP